MKIKIDYNYESDGMNMEMTGKFKCIQDCINFLEKLKKEFEDKDVKDD